jgi:undecaprenyl pyrophosphate synthase
MTVRLRDIPALPLIVLLHLIFTLSSLLVRIAEGLQRQDSLSTVVKPPRHVAVVFSVAPNSSKRALTAVRSTHQRKALVESVQRLVAWASEAGTTELSVWDGQGQCHRQVCEGVMTDSRAVATL